MTTKQDVNGIVVQIMKHRCHQRQVPLRRRKIKVYPGLKNDYWVNRWEVKIKLSYAVKGNPFDMIDPVINAVVEWDSRLYKERFKSIVEEKSEIMKRAAYLERTLDHEGYIRFVESLLPHVNSKGGPDVDV